MNTQSTRLCVDSNKAKSNSVNMTFSLFQLCNAVLYNYKNTHKVLINILTQTNSL